MPKPYPNVFSQNEPSSQTITLDRFRKTGYESDEQHWTRVFTNLGFNESSVSGTRNSVTTVGYPRHLGMNNYSYNELRLKCWAGNVVKTMITPTATTWKEIEKTSGCWQNGIYYQGHSFLGLQAGQQTNLINEAKSKAMSRVKDQKSNWSENAATARQAINMIADKVKMLSQSMHALKTGNVLKAAQALGVSPPSGSGGYSRRFARNRAKAVARQWLELQYGWRPLIQDIYETTRLVIDRYNNKPPLERFTANAKFSGDAATVDSSGWLHGNLTVKKQIHVKVKVVYYFAVNSPTLQTLKQMGVTNPAALAWELLPFSFVLDWLLPIGSMFSNLDAGLGLKYVKGCTTIGIEQINIGTKQGKQVSGNWLYEFNLSSTMRQVSIVRTQETIFPIVTLPYFKNPVSAEHLANALALLAVNWRR